MPDVSICAHRLPDVKLTAYFAFCFIWARTVKVM